MVWHVIHCMHEKGNAPYPEMLPLKLQQSSCIAAKCVAPPQQRYAAARSAAPSRKNVKEAAVQSLSPVLGSAAVVAVAVLGLGTLATVVLVTVVTVLVVVVAGFSEGFAVGPAVGSPAAGLASAGDLSAPSPGTSPLSDSPTGGVATSGSTTTCVATAPEASTHHATSTKGPAGRRHKSRGHKRPARACNAAVGAGRIKPRGVDG